MKLPMWFNRHALIAGGPYLAKPKGYIGVKMAVEIRADCDIYIPTADYNVPSKVQLDAGLEGAVDMILAGKPLYVGCMGGIGRTGLFLAVLAKTWGITNPVEYVRANYYSHAVETNQQFEFVANYKVPQIVLLKISLSKCLSFMRPLCITQEQKIP